MQIHSPFRALTVTITCLAAASACDSTDGETPGYYGPTDTQMTASPATSAARATGPGNAMAGAGADDNSMPPAPVNTGVSESALHPSPTGQADPTAAGPAPQVPVAASAAVIEPMTNTNSGTDPNGQPAHETQVGAGTVDPPEIATTGGKCDLSGRWLVTLHEVSDALGMQQTAHRWMYYELVQQGDAVTVAKGLGCGDNAEAGPPFNILVDFSGAWDAVTEKVRYDGRAGRSVKVDGGCAIEFERALIVRGATTAHYSDPAVPLPTVAQQASGDTPGWEDWDMDGKPGITGRISGTVSGEVMVAPRDWHEMSGTVGDPSSNFILQLEWDQEQNLLAASNPFFAAEAVRSADPSLHFVEFARLAEDQAAAGDDLAVCEAIRDLAPSLTPTAAGL